MTAAAGDAPEDYGKKVIGSALGKFAVRSFIFPVFLLGAWIAGAGLHDPDTCWLVALGRVIAQTGKLPVTDPFSYTFALSPKPYVMYQWLSELIFYLLYAAGGLLLLLCAVALILYVAFVCIPLLSFDRLGLPRLRSFTLILLAVAAASFHLLVRPEVFSYLMLSAWLSLTLIMRTQDVEAQEAKRAQAIDWRLVSGFCALMVVWCNLHTGFTSGLTMLAEYVVLSTLYWLFVLIKSRMSAESSVMVARPYVYKTAAVALAGALIATLANPRLEGLWSYIPLLFFSPINKYIRELFPLGLAQLTDWQYYPFYILSILAVWDCVRSVRNREQNTRFGWFSPVWIATLIVLGFNMRRLIPFDSLALMYECAFLRSRLSAPSETGKSVLDHANARMKELFSPDARWLVLHGVLVIAGVLLIASGPVKPHLPQGSGVFAFPTEVIEYMKQNPLQGHGFNTPQLGDVMIWHLNPCPQIFIDTRFDMYGADLVKEYMAIVNCDPGWQEALAKYDVKWIFLTPDVKLAQELAHSDSWKKVCESRMHSEKSSEDGKVTSVLYVAADRGAKE